MQDAILPKMLVVKGAILFFKNEFAIWVIYQHCLNATHFLVLFV